MNSNEMVISARLADHYESKVPEGTDALDAAMYDVAKVKREAPEMWQWLWASNMSSRQIGDWLHDFFSQCLASGQSFKHFAADYMETVD